MTDPLFNNIKTISAIRSIKAYKNIQDNHWVYLIGENHALYGSSEDPKLIDIVRNNKDAVIFLEKSADEAFYAAEIVKNDRTQRYAPLQEFAYNYFYGKPLSIVFADVRRDTPYHILSSIYDYGSFLKIFHNTTMRNYETFATLRKDIKTFERTVYNHIHSRKQCLSFLRAMVYPDKPIPKWYSDYIVKLAGNVTTPTPSLKQAMSESANKPWYNMLCTYIEYNWDKLTTMNEDYSSAIRNVESSIKNHSNTVIADKYIELELYFAVLFGILMETYMFLLIQSSKLPIRIALVGEDHLLRMQDFFDKHPDYVCMYKANASDPTYLDLYADRDYLYHENPYNAIQALRLFKARRKRSINKNKNA
jgi:hypothetical protein